jgi:hypothetical protein
MSSKRVYMGIRRKNTHRPLDRRGGISTDGTVVSESRGH